MIVPSHLRAIHFAVSPRVAPQTTCNSLRAQLDALKSEHMERAVAAGAGHAADKADSAGMHIDMWQRGDGWDGNGDDIVGGNAEQ